MGYHVVGGMSIAIKKSDPCIAQGRILTLDHHQILQTIKKVV